MVVLDDVVVSLTNQTLQAVHAVPLLGVKDLPAIERNRSPCTHRPVPKDLVALGVVKELVEDFTGQRLRLSKAEHLKFLTIIDPRQNKLLEVDISISSNTSPNIQVTAAFSRQETVFFKFKGGFVVE